jgi:aminopeptidase N
VDELACTGVDGPGGPLVFTQAGDSLVVRLPAPLGPGDPVVLTVAWEGEPPAHGPFRTGLMFRNHESGTLDDPSDDVPVIASMSQPWSSHAWWPCKDTPGDKALVGMAVTAPDTLVAHANGARLGRTDHGDGWATTRWASEYPVAPYLVSVAVSNYVGQGEACSIPDHPWVISSWHVFPQHRQAAFVDLGRTCEIMEFIAGFAGPYPFHYEGYRQVEFKWFGSMEHQTASSLSQIVFTGDRRWEGVVVHELAHQWYGNSLTPAQWSDIWLNEGFARYVEALWIEHDRGNAAYREFMKLIGPGWHPNLFQGEGTLGDPHPILPNGVIYDKGAWVLHMLRMRIGDDAFFDFLGRYAGDPDLMFGHTTLAAMIRHAEDAAGEDLSFFFDPWVWTETVPVLATGTRIDDLGVARLTLTQQQSPLFDLAVPVRLYTACDSTDFLVKFRTRTVEESWAPDCPVDSLVVDPDGMVLMRQGSASTPTITVSGPAPNPVAGTSAAFEIHLLSDAQVTVKMYDVRGALLASETTGRLAATGPPGEDARPHRWEWDPRSVGRRPAAGVYWLEFVPDAGGRVVKKITLLN